MTIPELFDRAAELIKQDDRPQSRVVYGIWMDQTRVFESDGGQNAMPLAAALESIRETVAEEIHARGDGADDRAQELEILDAAVSTALSEISP